MSSARHSSASPSHYDFDARHYDAFNERNSAVINRTIERALRKHDVRTVLDLTCGTGSQAFWLARRGFQVTGVDINERMLSHAKRKAKALKFPVTLDKGDMRTAKVGAFDAVITISSSVGHLTRADFAKAIRNIRHNLKSRGLYLFDIFNRSCLARDGNISRLTIDWAKSVGNLGIRYIQYSTIDGDGVLASYTTFMSERGTHPPRVSRSAQTLQTYSPADLKGLLRRNGFEVVRQYGPDGSKLDATSEQILTIARKR